MADTTTAYTMFRDVVPEFASVDDDEVKDWLDFVAPNVNVEFWGESWAQAVVWRAAHFMKTVGPGASAQTTDAAGPVTSRKAGPRSISFGNLSSSSDSAEEREWMTTTYGRKYLALRRSRGYNSPALISLA